MKRLLAIGLSVFMLLGLITGCSNNNPSSTAPPTASPSGSTAPATTGGGANNFGDTLTVVSNTKGSNFDPLTNYDVDFNVCDQIYDTLFRIDENGNIAPRLAESWEESEDGMKLTVKLRQDVTFHDGTPFNAEAVAYSLDVSHGVELNAWLNDLIPEWKVIDEYTIEISKGQPYTPILYSLAHRPHIVSPTAYEADPEAFAKNPVGTGSYKFVSMGSDNYVTMVANENYFDGEPSFKNLVIRPAMDSSTAVIALQNGEVDVVIELAPSQVAVANDIEGLTVVETTGWAQTMLTMAGDAFKDNRKLRQAVAYAVDPQKAAVLNEKPNATVATDLFSAKQMGVYAGLVSPLGYDPEKAKELVAESGYTSDMVIPIRVKQIHVALAQSVQADLQAVGIESEIQQVDEATYGNYLTDGDYGITFWEYGNDQSSSEDLLTYFVSTNFYGRYMEASSEYDAFVAQFGDFPTDEARKDVMKSALELQVEFANMVPLYESNFNFVYRTGLAGFNPWSASSYSYYFGDIYAE